MLAAARASGRPSETQAACGVAAEDIAQAAHLFGAAGAGLALWSMGANQSTEGTPSTARS